MLVGRRLAPLCRRAARSMCDRPPKASSPKQKVDKNEHKTSSKKNDNDKPEEVGDYVNPVTGEIGGPKGPEPTRYGDWEKKGRVSDF